MRIAHIAPFYAPVIGGVEEVVKTFVVIHKQTDERYRPLYIGDEDSPHRVA